VNLTLSNSRFCVLLLPY